MFDLTKKDETERHQHAFDEAAEEGKNGGFVDDIFHELEEIITTVVPGETTERQSRRAGFEYGRSKRGRW